MTRVEIEYCVPCGHRDRAVDLQTSLLDLLGRQLDLVSLRPGDGGVFVVRVDGERVFDKAEAAYDRDAVVDRVSDRV